MIYEAHSDWWPFVLRKTVFCSAFCRVLQSVWRPFASLYCLAVYINYVFAGMSFSRRLCILYVIIAVFYVYSLVSLDDEFDRLFMSDLHSQSASCLIYVKNMWFLSQIWKKHSKIFAGLGKTPYFCIRFSGLVPVKRVLWQNGTGEEAARRSWEIHVQSAL